MGNGCDHCSYHSNCDHIISSLFYKPVYDHVKQSCIRQNPKINNRKNKQNTITGSCLNAICNKSQNVCRNKPQDQAEMVGTIANTTIGDIFPFKRRATITMIIKNPIAAAIIFSSFICILFYTYKIK
mgnify:CR=1 FL=1